MHLPPGIEWSHEDATMLYWSRDNATNSSSNGSDITAVTLTGATIASPIIMFLSGVIGNLLALMVLHRTRMESQRMMFHSLVAGLVWNDLTGIVLTSPVTIASYINGLQMPGGEHLCKFNGFIMICFGLSTPLIVSAMAIERFLFVKYTFFYTKHCAPGVARLVIVAIWAFVLFFGLLPMFGFGNYVLQYPRTWCFLDFRTHNPVDAAYGYLYSSLNLLLVVVMVMCNLVVVLTLAQVRGYRRKHSNTSVNSVMLADGMMDDSQKQQAVRRRKQKDIELQMIVVMCAITTIFAACWAPLMIHISLTLATEGKTLDVLGLVAVRLASLNQTLNPWLYVILRRALIVRVQRYCCRWRRWLRAKPRFKAPPVGRRHQYVHVRNQLCHKNNFVGAEVKDDLISLSQSMRRSLQQAIPAAMSLPDVMMVNTGRRDLDIPMPDVAKAESFAGRVSHSCSIDSILTCAYCNAPVVAECLECFRERYLAPRGVDGHKNTSLHGDTSRYDNKSAVCDKYNSIKGDDNAKEKSDENKLEPKENQKKGGSSEPCPSQNNSPENYAINKEHRICSKHSSLSKQSSSGQRNTSPLTPGSDHLQNKSGNDTAPTPSPTPMYFLQSRDHSHRLSQHMHSPKSNSKSSSVKTARSKIHPMSQRSNSEDAQIFKPSPTRKDIVRHASGNSETSQEKDAKEPCLDDSRDSDDVFHDGTFKPCMETTNEITTHNDPAFSIIPTESFCLSDTSATQNCRISQVSPVTNIDKIRNKDTGANLCTVQEGLDSRRSPKHDETEIKRNDFSNAKDHIPETLPLIPQLNLPSFSTPNEPNHIKLQSPAEDNQIGCAVSGSACQLEEEHCESQFDSSAESERSSGVFSAESPVRIYRDHESQPTWQLNKESQSEPHRGGIFAKQVSRRLHSCN